MKKIATILGCTLFILAFSTSAMAEECTTIQSGGLLASDGSTIEVGFDQWGYNYQAHLFNGMYCDAYRDAAWCQPYKEDHLSMKWNDAWLSNQDCDENGLLDRHYGYDSYIGSGAWLTNHAKGEYLEDGKTCKWSEFIKIVAAPDGAKVVDGYWVNESGVEIGQAIWGSFAIIEYILNDKCAGFHGSQYNSPDHSGLGNW
jgi:hypothetical protein